MWIFGYGSLIWKPDFPFLASHPAQFSGWQRRFYQGSPDHRGTPETPGRVVTLLEKEGESCDGLVFQVDPTTASRIVAKLDHRESGGYEQHRVTVQVVEQGFEGKVLEDVLLYVASPNNPNFLGSAPTQEMAIQILHSKGPSGANVEYLFELANALQTLGIQDSHIVELEQEVKRLQKKS